MAVPPAVQKAFVRAAGNLPVVSVRIHHQCDAQLLEIVHARYVLRFALCPRQRREQQPRQDCDDGDYYQQLNESEGVFTIYKHNVLLIWLVYRPCR